MGCFGSATFIIWPVIKKLFSSEQLGLVSGADGPHPVSSSARKDLRRPKELRRWLRLPLRRLRRRRHRVRRVRHFGIRVELLQLQLQV